MSAVEPIGGARAAGMPPPSEAMPTARRDPMTSERVLIHAPGGRDGDLTRRVLGDQGLRCELFPTCELLVEAIGRGAGVALLASECFDPPTIDLLVRMLDGQPLWSDLPILVVTRESEDSARIIQALGPSANLTLLERPVWLANLVTAVRAGVRARRRQYEVRDLVERLAESDRLKDEFLAMLGHELRNPLNAIATAAAILREDGGCAGSVERQARLIGRQTVHLSRMVDDLLDFSRLSVGKIELRTERLDLRDAARGAVETLEMAGFHGRHHMKIEIPDAPVPLVGDPIRLEQVIANLLQNAVKYTPDGGHIELVIETDDENARLTVRDDGLGIPPEGIAAIFAPFIQLRAGGSTPTVGGATPMGGLGIGLYLARRLAHLHDGRLEARSDGPGRGSEFTFLLPLAEDGAERTRGDGGTEETSIEPSGAPRPAADGDARVDGGDGLKVLVVEDNLEGGQALVELLRIWGCSVDWATTGSEGVELALEARPKLALVDIGLPDIEGYEVARSVRAEIGGSCRLIALTGYGQPEDRRRALEAGFDEHMVKPVDPQRLTALLDEMRGDGAAS